MSGTPHHITVRRADRDDQTALDTLYAAVFPDEDLVPLVRALGDEPEATMLVAASAEDQVVGHVGMTLCGVSGHPARVGLLGPLAVAADHRRRGIARALINAAVDATRDARGDRICVLGDPAFYGRFGFGAERDITPPYPLPEEWDGAWQSKRIEPSNAGGNRPDTTEGQLSVPTVWTPRALWTP